MTAPIGVRRKARPAAELSFKYGANVLPPDVPGRVLSQVSAAGVITRRYRQSDIERRAFDALVAAGLQQSPMAPVLAFAASDEATRWPDFVRREVPRLRALGWRVTFADDFPYNIVDLESPLVVSATTSKGAAELQVTSTIGGRRVDLVPAIVEAVARGLQPQEGAKVMYLPDPARSRSFVVPTAQFKRIRVIFEEVQAEKARARRATVPLGRLVSQLADNEELEIRGIGARKIKAAAAELCAPLVKQREPKSFRGKLRAYQRIGLGWLQRQARIGLGAMLCDEMGLGKTIQTLAHILTEVEAERLTAPVLVVAPKTVISEWCTDAAKFTPSLRVIAHEKARRAKDLRSFRNCDIVVTSYDLLVRDQEMLRRKTWGMVVLDEAQRIKSPTSEATRTAYALRAGHRIALTGTPIENHLGELWAISAFIQPSLLGSRKAFKAMFRAPIERDGDPERVAVLTRRLSHFMIRRLKKDVAKELPPKDIISRPIEMTEDQREAYDTVEAMARDRIRELIAQKGLHASYMDILTAITRQRQVCDDPRLVMKTKVVGAKLTVLVSMLEELRADGRKTVVYSSFERMIFMIQKELRKKRISFSTVTGSTKERKPPVDQFQAGEVDVFLGTTKAAGLGINLTNADVVVLFDPWWNPQVENQAIDRSHRIGGKKHLTVYRLFCVDSIEERVMALADKKAGLAQAIYDETRNAFDKGVTIEDIQRLFEG